MEKMHDIAYSAIDQIPPSQRLRQEDREVIVRNKENLLALGPYIVKSFYDTLYDHPPTAAVFHAGERHDREGTLVNWWSRTVNGPLDDDYFAWMALVGLVHVMRNVTNPMMLVMSDHVALIV
ncbi:MAG: globin domain protein, partial [Propionibacterium sp.]